MVLAQKQNDQHNRLESSKTDLYMKFKYITEVAWKINGEGGEIIYLQK